MRIEKLENHRIIVSIPLTTQSGKIRVKERNSFYEYGLPVATRQISFSQKHYIEWQIGYDVDKNDREKFNLSTLQNSEFIGANGKKKALYELSEYLYYFTQWGIIDETEIESLYAFLSNIKNDDFIDSREDLQIFRSHPKEKQILDIAFYISEVKYKERIIENLGAWNIKLSEDEFLDLDKALNVLKIAGNRGFVEYEGMKMKDWGKNP